MPPAIKEIQRCYVVINRLALVSLGDQEGFRISFLSITELTDFWDSNLIINIIFIVIASLEPFT